MNWPAWLALLLAMGSGHAAQADHPVVGLLLWITAAVMLSEAVRP